MPDAPFEDVAEHHDVVRRDVLSEGYLLTFVREAFDYNDAEIVREFVEAPGAVGIVALDENDRVLTIRQYRHPIRTRAWELPAGLLDSADEPLLGAAQRELAEETDMAASEWNVLADIATSSGSNTEIVRIFLARGLSPITSGFVRDEEEADIETRWVAIDEVVHAISAGKVRNVILVSGVLAAFAARARGWDGLRSA